MENTREIRKNIRFVYIKLIIISITLFILAGRLSNTIIDFNEGTVKSYFCGFIGVIILREIRISAIISVLLIVNTKFTNPFSELWQNYILKIYLVLQTIISIVMLFVTMIKDIKPNKWFLCIIGFFLSVLILFLFFKINEFGVFKNIVYLYNLYEISKLLDYYYEKKLKIAGNYNCIAEKYNNMNDEIYDFCKMIEKNYDFNVLEIISTDDFPVYEAYSTRMFISDYDDIDEYALEVGRYVTEVDHISDKSKINTKYIRIVYDNKISILNGIKDIIKFSDQHIFSSPFLTEKEKNRKRQDMINRLSGFYVSLSEKTDIERKIVTKIE